MPNWEYLRLDVTYNDRTINPGIHSIVVNGNQLFSQEDSETWDTAQLYVYVTGLGKEGWELVSHAKSDYHEVHYFKRLID